MTITGSMPRVQVNDLRADVQHKTYGIEYLTPAKIALIKRGKNKGQISQHQATLVFLKAGNLLNEKLERIFLLNACFLSVRV